MPELAECLGTTRQAAFAMLERARSGGITINNLHRLCKCLGITMNAFIILYHMDKYEDELKNLEEQAIRTLERMKEKSPEVAYAYFLELRAMGKATPRVVEWFNANL